LRGVDGRQPGDNPTLEIVEGLRAQLAAERRKSYDLWMLLDDIDTVDDVVKKDDELFRTMVRAFQRQRFEILSGEEIDSRHKEFSKNG